jgi:hypothetical protein
MPNLNWKRKRRFRTVARGVAGGTSAQRSTPRFIASSGMDQYHCSRRALRHLGLDTAIRLRWALHDIKGKRTKLMPVSPEDVRTLVELGLIEMHDDLPALTNEGARALDCS